ncbi:MAG: hypothetical protein ACM3S2_17770 [Ignavibacteriales bacterium]
MEVVLITCVTLAINILILSAIILFYSNFKPGHTEALEDHDRPAAYTAMLQPDEPHFNNLKDLPAPGIPALTPINVNRFIDKVHPAVNPGQQSSQNHYRITGNQTRRPIHLSIYKGDGSSSGGARATRSSSKRGLDS